MKRFNFWIHCWNFQRAHQMNSLIYLTLGMQTLHMHRKRKFSGFSNEKKSTWTNKYYVNTFTALMKRYNFSLMQQKKKKKHSDNFYDRVFWIWVHWQKGNFRKKSYLEVGSREDQEVEGAGIYTCRINKNQAILSNINH